MTIETCYEQLKGKYAEVLSRLHSKNMIERFAIKFLDDTSYNDFVNALEDGDVNTAFRAVHNLKGVCANLGFSYLQNQASIVTELLRAGDFMGACKAYPDLDVAYQLTVDVLKKFKENRE